MVQGHNPPTEAAAERDPSEGNDRSPPFSWETPELSPSRVSSPLTQHDVNPSASDPWEEEPSGEQESSGLNSGPDPSDPHPAEQIDDGGRRCLRRRPLHGVPEARVASGLELEESAAQASAAKRKRKRGKGKTDVRCGRGLARPRDPAKPEDRPKLMIVGDGAFSSIPKCTKIISTIRLLTLENLPGPYRSWNSFPSKTRLFILKQFLQRYSWGLGQDITRCIEVFERVAADAYMTHLMEERARYKKKYGEEKEVWKDNPPAWCKTAEYWKGLVQIWSKEKFVQQSATNRTNRVGRLGEKVVHHVTGSRSMYRHKEAMVMNIT
jgi:hypothetical protein